MRPRDQCGQLVDEPQLGDEQHGAAIALPLGRPKDELPLIDMLGPANAGSEIHLGVSGRGYVLPVGDFDRKLGERLTLASGWSETGHLETIGPFTFGVLDGFFETFAKLPFRPLLEENLDLTVH